LHGVFFNSERLRAGWRALLYLVLVIGLSIVAEQHRWSGIWSLAGRLIAVLIVVLALWIMARFVDRRPVSWFGLGRQGLGARLTAGLVSGFVSLSLLLALIRAAGCFSFPGGRSARRAGDRPVRAAIHRDVRSGGIV
jgi:hypothetical protein